MVYVLSIPGIRRHFRWVGGQRGCGRQCGGNTSFRDQFFASTNRVVNWQGVFFNIVLSAYVLFRVTVFACSIGPCAKQRSRWYASFAFWRTRRNTRRQNHRGWKDGSCRGLFWFIRLLASFISTVLWECVFLRLLVMLAITKGEVYVREWKFNGIYANNCRNGVGKK